jgi:hypothetical protein
VTRGAKSPWRKQMLFQSSWRCECNRLVSNKLKTCDKCGREKKNATTPTKSN